MTTPQSSRRCAAILALACLLSAGLLSAADKPQERPLQNERYRIHYVVQADGSFVEEREMATKVLQEQALAYAKQDSINYSTSIQKADVLEAYTLKADGRRIDVPKSNYQVKTNGGKGDGGPVFSDISTLTVVYPELSVGDTTVLSYRLTASQPMFDGQFSDVDIFDSHRYYGDVEISIDAPTSLHLQTRAWKLKQTRNETNGDRIRMAWSYRNREPAEDERSEAAIFDYEDEPGVAFSTFKTYRDIASAYGIRATPKAAVTPRVQRTADEIVKTAKATAPRDIAKALYEWVSTNITYAGNCIGLGAVVPHDIDFILDNKMGDCKDHATLLQALLSAKGIASDQALINAGNTYRLPTLPIASAVNHVFNYVPSLDLYLDATAKGIPFGMLPIQSVSKPILLVSGERPDAKTPAWPVGRNRQVMRTKLKIAADGSIDGKVSVETSGLYAVQVRAFFRSLSGRDLDEAFFKDAYSKDGLTGSGKLTNDDPKPLTDEFKYSAQFEVKQLLPMPGAFPIGPSFFSVGPVARFVSDVNQDDDKTGLTTCISGYSEEEYVYEFPAGVKVVAVPPNLNLGDEILSYSATYKLDDNVLTARRVVDDRTPGPTCTPEASAAYRAIIKKVLPNLKAQIVYQ